MQHDHRSVPFGITDQCFPPGTHVCQIYTDEQERQDSVGKFLLAGLQKGECASCFSEKITAQSLHEFFEQEGISIDKAQQSGALRLSGTKDAYFEQNCFNPEKILSLLEQYHTDSLDQGFSNARVIGEMTADIERVEGGERLLEYESRVSLLLKEHPITAVCQYSAHDFSGAMIMDVLRVHPFMIVHGSVVHNPFYLTPEQFLA